MAEIRAMIKAYAPLVYERTEPKFSIVVKHKTEAEIVVEEEKRRKLVKSKQRKNKRKKR